MKVFEVTLRIVYDPDKVKPGNRPVTDFLEGRLVDALRFADGVLAVGALQNLPDLSKD